MQSSKKQNESRCLSIISEIHESSSHHLVTASCQSTKSLGRLICGIRELDLCLGGGLPRGSLIEWGAPMGRGGRELLIPWLRATTNPQDTSAAPDWALWAYGAERLIPFAPAWSARGIALERLRFAQTVAPLTELLPIFMEPLFRMIVLDISQAFSPEQYAFMSRQARLHDQIIVIIRDHLLTPASGNVWARIRLNTWLLDQPDTYRVEILKGSSVRQVSITLP